MTWQCQANGSQIVTNGMKLESAVDDSPWNALVYD